MNRRNGKLIHSNRLVPSSYDEVSLCQAVEDRFLDLTRSWQRIKGESLPIPAELDKDMLRWRQMRMRHRCQKCGNKEVLVLPGKSICCSYCGGFGDYRHTEAELKSLRTIAEWTVDMNCVLRNQPKITLNWR